ncbi:MAG: hypothetical protein ACI3V2_10295 [Faecousia sp.]
MLRKLLKYDLRANMKIFLFIWPAIIVFAVIERLAISADLEGKLGTVLISTTTTVFVLGVIAACIVSLVVSIVRFYSGLLRDEGYLMFTLPVKPWQLILSKFLTALLTVVVTGLISVLASWYLFDGINGFYVTVRMLWYELDLPSGMTLLLVGLIIFASICMLLLQIYLSCSIGQLFKRHRILWSVLVYYGINVVIEILSVSSLIGFNAFSAFAYTATIREVNLLLGIVLAVQAALCVLYFFLSECILRKKLNLE